MLKKTVLIIHKKNLKKTNQDTLVIKTIENISSKLIN